MWWRTVLTGVDVIVLLITASLLYKRMGWGVMLVLVPFAMAANSGLSEVMYFIHWCFPWWSLWKNVDRAHMVFDALASGILSVCSIGLCIHMRRYGQTPGGTAFLRETAPPLRN